MFDRTIEPRVPFTAAEQHVDFAAIDDHIVMERKRLEQTLQPTLKRYSESLLLHHGIAGMKQLHDLEATMTAGLLWTFRFGFDQAEAEINRLRDVKGDRPRLIAAAARIPQTANEARSFCLGLAHQRLGVFNNRCVAWYGKLENVEDFGWQEKVRDRCRRELHNAVLDVIGKTLNAGRTLAALGGSTPNRITIAATVAPVAWAMRSEQLDTNTCAPCDHIHGLVTEVGSVEYYLNLPPAGCLGGGRCRGVEVYSDDPNDFA